MPSTCSRTARWITPSSRNSCTSRAEALRTPSVASIWITSGSVRSGGKTTRLMSSHTMDHTMPMAEGSA